MSSCSDAAGDGGVTLALDEVVDVTTVRTLHAQAVAALHAVGPIVVDCAAVARMDAAALQVLLALRRAAEGRCTVVHVPPALDALWRLAGVRALLGAEDRS
jgi:ABC-type transporter Mla MlaB component